MRFYRAITTSPVILNPVITGSLGYEGEQLTGQWSEPRLLHKATNGTQRTSQITGTGTLLPSRPIIFSPVVSFECL